MNKKKRNAAEQSHFPIDGFLLTHKGMENIAGEEVHSLIGKKATLSDQLITFPLQTFEELFTLCYTSRTALRIGMLLRTFSYTELIGSIAAELPKMDFSLIGKEDTIAVRCHKLAEIKEPSQHIEKEASTIILDAIKQKTGYVQMVDLEHPIITIILFVSDKQCFVCIDFAGYDLSKRSYLVFTYPAGIKGTIAYALVHFSGYEGKGVFVDSFTGSGIIPVEAALSAINFPVRFYDKSSFCFREFSLFKAFDFDSFFSNIDKKIKDAKSEIFAIDSSMKHVNYAKKNAKIAGIVKSIEFRRIEMEWLDTRFKKETVDFFASKMPATKEQFAEKHYKEFFYQAEYVLKSKGIICVIGNRQFIEKYAALYKFNIEKEQVIYSGKEAHTIFLIRKQQQNT